METWESSLASRTDLEPYGANAIGLFAIGLRFDVDDLVSVAADAITDGSDDKKCDLIYIDRDEHAAIVAQCFFSKTHKPSAPAGKAADLNTAIASLLQTPLEKLPLRIKAAAADLRQGLKDEVISELHVWYVHNLSESKNAADQMAVVENTATVAIQSGMGLS